MTRTRMTDESMAQLHTASASMRETQQALNKARAALPQKTKEAELVRELGLIHDGLRLALDEFLDGVAKLEREEVEN